MNSSIDVNQLSIIQMVVLAFLAIAVLAVLFYLMNKFKINKFGPIGSEFKDSLKEFNNWVMAQSYLDNELDDCDIWFKLKSHEITNMIELHVLNELRAANPNNNIKNLAIALSVKFPLYNSIANNHLIKLMQPDSIAEYKNTILTQIKDEYLDIFYTSGEELPKITEVESIISRNFNLWVDLIKSKLLTVAKQKLCIYIKYSDRLNGSEFQVGLIKSNTDELKLNIEGLESDDNKSKT